MRYGKFFLNINPISTRGGGYQLRLINKTVGNHIEYFHGLTKNSLRKALKARNKYYIDYHYLPQGLTVRYASPCKAVTDNLTGFNGIGLLVCGKRVETPYILFSKVLNLITRKQTHFEIVVSGLAVKNSAELKKAVKLRRKNINQHDQIAAEYNRLRVKKYLPYALKEAKTLETHLNEHCFFDPATWHKAFKNVFPKGLEKSYLARE